MAKGAEEQWKKSAQRAVIVLRVCGFFITLLGVLLMGAMFFSFIAPEQALHLILGKMRVPFKSVAGSSWAQVAVAFGMHRSFLIHFAPHML
jgi:fumarate reductase subunit C